MEQKEKDTKYNRWAREIPTYICMAFPFSLFLFVLFEMDKERQDSIQWFLAKAVMWGAAIFPALFFLLRMIIRDFSSLIADNLLFQWWGKYYLWPRFMYRIFLKEGTCISDNSMKEIKNNLSKKGFKLDDCKNDEKKRIIKEIIEYIKNSTRDDGIVFEYNIFYGFYRNMVGGLFLINLLFYFLSFLDFNLTNNLKTEISTIHLIIWALFGICLFFMYYSDYKYAVKMIYYYLTIKDKQ